MASNAPVANMKTPEGRVSFPKVFERSDYSGKFEITLVFSKGTDLSELIKAAKQAAIDKWGNKISSGLRNPFRKCSEKPDYYGEDFDPNDIFVTFRSQKRQPGVVNASNHYITEEGELYPGCWARVSCNAYAYDIKGNKGVAFGVINIQKTRDDNPLVGSAVKADDDFEALPGSSEDPTAYGGVTDDLFGPGVPQGTSENIFNDEDDIPF